MTGHARCGSPSSPTSSAIRSRARSTECSGRREMISRSTSRIRCSMSTVPAYVRRGQASDRGEALLQAGDVGLGRLKALAGLVDHRGGRLGGEVGVGQLPLRLLGLGSRRREILLHPTALGRDVDDAGHVEFGGDALDLDRRRRGKAVGGRRSEERRGGKGGSYGGAAT